MPGQVNHGELVISELEEAIQAKGASIYPPEVDAVLLAYGGRAPWPAIRAYIKKECDFERSTDALRKHLYTLKECQADRT